QNYRSTEAILEAAHKVIKNNQFRTEKRLWTAEKGGDRVQFREFANELEEARFIAQEAQTLMREKNWQRKDIAVFYRTNAQSRVLEDAFRRENLPYTVVGSVRFYERMEVKDVMAYLRLLVNPADSVSAKRILNVPPRGIGKTTVQALENEAAAKGTTFFETIQHAARNPYLTAAARGNLQKFMDVLQPLLTMAEAGTADCASEKCRVGTASQMVKAVLETTGYWAHWEAQVTSDPEATQRLDNLQELVNAAKDFEESAEDKSVAAFLEKVTLASGVDTWDDEGGTVTLMTVHLAKGLEFPAVFLTGMEDGLFPIGESAFDERELEEERRLCYVGMTRAEERLCLTASASRKIYGRSHWNVPSRFIAEAGLAAERPQAFVAPQPVERRAAVGSFDPDDGPFSHVEPHPGERQPLKAGMRVKHPMFGPGKILSKSGSGENLKVTVLFDSGARKDILVRYASFEILDE
ncbi:MAG: ATP-binding domain-containing protein, partial [Elusimicrobia bacterium]|nr:ATP-binding domain-containing protein [Elusimicrobiota bacterium]